jgi:hypothetical protein
LIKIDWSNSFLLNGPLVSYQLLVNNVSIYFGKNTKAITSYKVEKCVYSTFINEKNFITRGYFNVLDIELKVSTLYTNETSKLVRKILNCTSKLITILNYF